MTADVIYDTTVFAPSGYAYAARKYLLGLHKEGIKVSLQERKMDELTIQLSPEHQNVFNEMLRTPHDKDTLLVRYGTPVVFPLNEPLTQKTYLQFVWELEKLPPMWTRVLSETKYDRFITNTKFCKESITNSLPEYYQRSHGETDRIVDIVPHGVDLDVFYPDKDAPLYQFTDETFVFLAVGQWIRRKGFEEMITAYLQEFTSDDNVALILKTYGKNNHFGTMMNIMNSIKILSYKLGITHPPQIVIHAQMVNEDGLRKLYNSADCYILPSKGESWGLPYLQSMACGVPCIAQNFGGHVEYMNQKNSFLIEPQGKKLADGQGWYSPMQGLDWAVPSVDNIRKVMRLAFTNDAVLKKKSTQCLTDVKNWTWDLAAKKLADIITSG